MPSQYARPIGKPIVEKATNGLRKITRRYAVHGPSSVEALVEDRVFLPICTPDEEYTTALLVSQKLEGSADPSQDILVRTYLEVNDTPVEVDKPDYQRDGMGRVRVTRKFIVETAYPESYSADRVGVTTYTTDNNDICLLAKVTVDEHHCFTEYVEEYFQIGIISYKEEVRHNGKLVIRTYRSIGIKSDAEFESLVSLGSEWVLVQSMSGSGSTDYQFGGLEVRSWTVVKGAGRISLEEEDAGAAKITTEVIIVADGGDYSIHSDIPPDQVYETKVDDKQGYDLWTIKGVVGQGEIDRTHELRYNGALEIITIKAVGQQAAIPNGFVRVSEKHDQGGRFDVYTDVFVKGLGIISSEERDIGSAQITTEIWATENGGSPNHGIPTDQVYETKVEEKDGYEIHTISGIVGSGTVDRTEQTRHNGALSVITLKSVGAQSQPPVGYVRISERLDESGRFDVYTDVYAKGSGLISSTEEEKGQATLTTEVWITENGGNPSTSIPQGQIYRQTVEEKDGYEVHTIVGVEGSGELDRNHAYKHNGALEVITIKNIGQQSPIPAGFVRISEDEDRSGNFTIFTDVYAKGEGRVTTNSRVTSRNMLETTIVYLNADNGAVPAGCVIGEESHESDGYVTYKKTYSESLDDGQRNTGATTDSYGIAYITVERVGNEPAAPQGGVAVTRKNDDVLECIDGSDITHYRWTYAVLPDDLEVARDVRVSGDLTVTTIKEINGVPVNNGCVISKSQVELHDVDGAVFATIYERGFAEGDGEVSRSTSSSGGLTRTRIKSIGAVPVGNGCVVGRTETKVRDVDGVECNTVYEYEFLDGQGVLDRSIETRSGITYLRIKQLGAVPAGVGCIVSKSEEDIRDADGNVCNTIYDYTFASGQGEIERSSRVSDGKTILTIKMLGAVPVANGCVISEGTEDLNDATGNLCDVIHERSFLQFNARVTGMTIANTGTGVQTRIKSIGIVPFLNNACPMDRTESQILDVNGNLCATEYDYTFLAAPSNGEVSRVVNSGSDTVTTTIVAVGNQPVLAGACVKGRQNEVVVDLDGNDCFNKWTVDFIQGSGADRESVTHNADGSTRTRRQIVGNAAPAGPAGGCLVERGEEDILDINGNVCLTRYDYVWVNEPFGQIDTSVRHLENGKTITTVVATIKPLAGAGDCVVDSKEETVYDVDGNECYKIYTVSFLSGSGEFDRQTTNKDGLTYIRIKSAGVQPIVDHPNACLTAKSESVHKDAEGNDCGTVYDYTYLINMGCEELERSVENRSNGLTVTTVRSLDCEPDEDGCILSKKKEDIRDADGNVCTSIYTWSFATGTGEISRKSRTAPNGLRYISIRSLQTEPNNPNAPQPPAPPDPQKCLVNKSEETGKSADGSECYTIYDYEYLDGTPRDLEISYDTRDCLTYQTQKAINKEPDGSGCLVKKNLKDILDIDGNSCATLYEYTYVTGDGIISTSTKESGQMTHTTYKVLAATEEAAKAAITPPAGACLVSIERDETCGLGGADGCNNVFEITYAHGVGEISRVTEALPCGTGEKTTIRTVGVEPSGTGEIIKQSQSKMMSLDGSCEVTEYEYTYVNVGSSRVKSELFQYRADGSEIVTITEVAASQFHNVIHTNNEGGDYDCLLSRDAKCVDGMWLHTWTYMTLPATSETHETVVYRALGELDLDSDCYIKVVEPRRDAVVRAKVTTSYDPQAAFSVPEEAFGEVIHTMNIATKEGAINSKSAPISGYKLIGGIQNLGPCERSNVRVKGMVVSTIYVELTHAGVTGDSTIIKTTSTPYAWCGGQIIYQNRVWEYEYTGPAS